MLLIDVHELDIIFAEPITLAAFKNQVDGIRMVIGFQCQDVFVLCTSEDFHQGAEINAKSNVAVTSKRGEGFCFEHHRYQSDVGVVHGLQRDAGVIAVEVAVLDEVLNGIYHLARMVSQIQQKDLGA